MGIRRSASHQAIDINSLVKSPSARSKGYMTTAFRAGAATSTSNKGRDMDFRASVNKKPGKNKAAK